MREAGDVAALGVDEAGVFDEEARQHGAGPETRRPKRYM